MNKIKILCYIIEESKVYNIKFIYTYNIYTPIIFIIIYIVFI